MNTVVLSGRMTKDPELKYTSGGKANVRFTLAVQRTKDEADFVNCVAWERQQKLLQNILKKEVQFWCKEVSEVEATKKMGGQYIQQMFGYINLIFLAAVIKIIIKKIKIIMTRKRTIVFRFN